MSIRSVNRFGKVGGFNYLDEFRAAVRPQAVLRLPDAHVDLDLCVVGRHLLLSIPIALILNEDFAGRGIVRVIIMLPWAVSLTMSAIVWRWGLNGQFGMVNATLAGLGLSERADGMAGDRRDCFSDRDRGRHPGLHPVHRDGVPRRVVVAARRHLRSRRPRRCHFLASLALADAAAAQALHQHRAGAELHLRLQLVSNHLGDDPGRPGQQHRHPR